MKDFFGCYLLESHNPKRKGHSYIGWVDGGAGRAQGRRGGTLPPASAVIGDTGWVGRLRQRISRSCAKRPPAGHPGGNRRQLNRF